MARVVLRVRLCSGDHLDVLYEADTEVEDELIDGAIAILSKDGGALRTTHGGRMLVLFGRGVAALEIAPRGAVL